jgi:hypothetical protein
LNVVKSAQMGHPGSLCPGVVTRSHPRSGRRLRDVHELINPAKEGPLTPPQPLRGPFPGRLFRSRTLWRRSGPPIDRAEWFLRWNASLVNICPPRCPPRRRVSAPHRSDRRALRPWHTARP